MSRQEAPHGRIHGRIDFAAVNAAALPRLPELVRLWLPDGRRVGHEWIARNPTRLDRSPGSFSINLHTGLWADFATGDRGAAMLSPYLPTSPRGAKETPPGFSRRC